MKKDQKSSSKTKEDNYQTDVLKDTVTMGCEPWQVILGLLFLLSWIIIFLSGLLVDSEPFRNVISGTATTSSDAQQPGLIWSWVVVMFSYTPSNLFMVSLFAGMIGAVSRIAKLHITKDGQEEIPSDQTSPIISGVFRGMFLFLLILSGVVILDESVLTDPSQDQYAKLAGIVSLFCFLISYDPSRFRTLLDRGMKKLDGIDGADLSGRDSKA